MGRGFRLGALPAIVMIAATFSIGSAQFQAPPSDYSDSTPYPMVFPVAGEHSYSNTFGAPRSDGRTHEGTDIYADKLTPVVAVADGTVIRTAVGDLAGRYIVIRHTDGWLSYYLHLNNDTPGTDDGLGGEWLPGIEVGATVEAGTLIDYVGDSGNAEGTPPHLHFELHRADGTVVNSYGHLLEAQGIDAPRGSLGTLATSHGASTYENVNTSLVSHFDPGGGFTADVVVEGPIAYLGTWGRTGLCPNTGIRAIDVSDPRSPQPIGAFADEFPGTSAETVWVGHVETGAFTGELAVVTIRLCDNDEPGRLRDGFRGLAFYDVGDVSSPILLSTWHSGERTQGANSVDVQKRSDGRLLVAATVRQSLLHTDGDLGDTRIIDATDPASPVELSDWDNRRDGRPVVGGYDEEEMHAHDVQLSADGLSVWISHWDAGTILVDITDPERPRFVSAIGFIPEGEGNRHSSVTDDTGRLLIVNEEDLYPADDGKHRAGWGTQHIYDVSDPTAPIEIAQFSTEQAVDGDSLGLDGYYSVHETVLSGPLAISSWFSDGIRLVDLSDPSEPVEIGSFVPTRVADPVGYWIAPNGATALPMVWGVDVDGDLIFLSDINSGLWIVRYHDGTGPKTETSPSPDEPDRVLAYGASRPSLPGYARTE